MNEEIQRAERRFAKLLGEVFIPLVLIASVALAGMVVYAVKTLL